jgi:hypothetical protein
MNAVNRTSGPATHSTPSSEDPAASSPSQPAESVGVLVGRMSAMLDQSEEMSRRTRREARTAQRHAVSQQTAAMREAADDRFAGAVAGALGKIAGGVVQVVGGVDGLRSAGGSEAQTDKAEARGRIYSGSAQAAAAGGELIGAGFQKSADFENARATDLGAAAAMHGENAADDAKSIDSAQRSRDKMLDFASQISQAKAESRRAAVA